MFEASFSGVLKTILIVLMIYFGLKILFKWFGPMILRYFMKKMGKKFEQQFKQHQKPREKEGSVTIDKQKTSGKASDKDLGEYIDYEEID